MKSTSEPATYRQLFDNMVHDIELLLEDLPAEALLWKPFEHSPWRGPAGSLGWLIAHAISSTYYLLRRAEWMMGRLEWNAVDGTREAKSLARLTTIRSICWHALDACKATSINFLTASLLKTSRPAAPTRSNQDASSQRAMTSSMPLST